MDERTSFFDQIEMDREAGTDLPWVDEHDLPYGRMPRVHVTQKGALICEVGNVATSQDEWEGLARRIARVPDLEAIALAAEKMAEAVDLLFDQVSDGGSYTEATALKLNEALTAYRAAVAEIESRPDQSGRG